MQPLIAMVLFGMLIGGIVLLVKGLKRRYVPCEPRCGGCGYDLRGVPVPRGTGEGVRCPECGCELGYPGRVVRERGVRRWKLALVGAGMVLFVLGPGIVKEVASALTGNAERLTPAWVLDSRVRTRYGDADAANELARRMATRAISERRVRRLVEEGLAWQSRASADGVHLFTVRPSGIYTPSEGEELLWRGAHWPTLLEAALMHGYMSDEQVERFLSRGLLVEVYVTDERTLDVQIISLLGPTLTAMLAMDVVESSFVRAGRRFTAMASGGAAPVWWWQFALREDVDRAHVMW